ncbi:hypothetical protein N7472_009702 [Penicillium cf. griseofulvum]|uniref:Uncharacterized protein n=1 Tax=Penicillium cf. griseofulvum TaxID=2972120 RepID=A0A9W9IVF8_9EURO|nr:hypothetical protein N7472_009702 [Penicillium cf. griseofulvum]KAJ5435977.1 hypothetical protein N7445_006862 [Penicillium cf. griseofulvum]
MDPNPMRMFTSKTDEGEDIYTKEGVTEWTLRPYAADWYGHSILAPAASSGMDFHRLENE